MGFSGLIEKSFWSLCSCDFFVLTVKKENGLYVLHCHYPSQKNHRELFLSNFESKLDYHRTYPPLAQLLYAIFEERTFEPPDEPIIADPTFMLILHRAF